MIAIILITAYLIGIPVSFYLMARWDMTRDLYDRHNAGLTAFSAFCWPWAILLLLIYYVSDRCNISKITKAAYNWCIKHPPIED